MATAEAVGSEHWKVLYLARQEGKNGSRKYLIMVGLFIQFLSLKMCSGRILLSYTFKASFICWSHSLSMGILTGKPAKFRDRNALQEYFFVCYTLDNSGQMNSTSK